MEEKNPLEFTPEEWTALYEKDPQLFERKRVEAIENMIAKAPSEKQEGLRVMQWQIDKRLHGSKTPLGRMQIMQTIFYDAVFLPGGLLAQLKYQCEQVVEAVRSHRDDQHARPKPKLTIVSK